MISLYNSIWNPWTKKLGIIVVSAAVISIGLVTLNDDDQLPKPISPTRDNHLANSTSPPPDSIGPARDLSTVVRAAARAAAARLAASDVATAQRIAESLGPSTGCMLVAAGSMPVHSKSDAMQERAARRQAIRQLDQIPGDVFIGHASAPLPDGGRIHVLLAIAC